MSALHFEKYFSNKLKNSVSMYGFRSQDVYNQCLSNIVSVFGKNQFLSGSNSASACGGPNFLSSCRDSQFRPK